MELRAYWRIIRRRWWLPVGLALAVFALTLVMNRPWQARPPSYQRDDALQRRRSAGAHSWRLHV